MNSAFRVPTFSWALIGDKNRTKSDLSTAKPDGTDKAI